MAIKSGEIITYKNLVDHFLDWVENRAGIININNLNNVPTSWKSYDKTIVVERADVHENQPINNVGVQINLDTNSTPKVVTMATIKSEFNDFMETRGLANYQNVNTPVTTRGIINFWNSVAAFCSTNIQLVSAGVTFNDSDIDRNTRRMYKSNRNWASIPDIGNGELIIASDITAMLANLEEVVNNVSKMHQIVYNISAFSSTSSSCSSSSCSSSSSSMYIAYMNI